MIYVAVVRKRDKITSHRQHGDWASFIGENKRIVVSKALEAARTWGEYEVILGTLTDVVVPLANFELQPLPSLREEER